MYSQLDQQVKIFDDLEASVLSVFDCSKALAQEICELPSNDKLQLLEEMKLHLESFAKLQKDIKVFRESFATIKNQMFAKNSTVTEDNVVSQIESYMVIDDVGSTISSGQAEILNQLDQHINSIKASQVPDVQEEEIVKEDIEEEEVITVTQYVEKTIDPLTMRNIENPVRNKVCGHMYEKTTITEYLNSNKIRKCPYAGCANRELRMHDIVDAV